MFTIDPARETAVYFLAQVDAGRVRLNQLAAAVSKETLNRRDTSFVRQLVYGTLRFRKRLDWIVDRFAHKPIATCSSLLQQILRVGTFQLCFLDRTPTHAAVDTSVAMAKRHVSRGSAKMVNAVLRRVGAEINQIPFPPRDTQLLDYLEVYQSHPRWLTERWLGRWGSDLTEATLAANNNPAPTTIRANRLRIGINELPKRLGDDGIEVTRTGPLEGFFEVRSGEELFNSPSFNEGLFQVQDVNAALPVALLDPQPGETLLDCCAAPGGKTTQIAEWINDRGLVVAVDLRPSRLRMVRENTERLGFRSIRPIAQDITHFSHRFDKVLADVPCLGTGVLGRRPDVRWRRTAYDLSVITATQDAILTHAFENVKPGGILTYSTCSLEPEENELLVDRFLEAEPSAWLEPAEQTFPNSPWAGRFIETIPGRDGGDGCFAARIRRLK